MEQDNQRIMITKRLLKESMLHLLKEKEPDQISVAELCRGAGINRATFYRHYAIPRDVLMEIQKDLYHEFRSQISLPASPEDIRPALEELCACLEKRIDILRLLIQVNPGTDFVCFINEIFLELYREHGPQTINSQMNQEDIRLLTLYCAGGSYFLLRSWIMGDIRKSAKEMVECVYALLVKTDWNMVGKQFGQ